MYPFQIYKWNGYSTERIMSCSLLWTNWAILLFQLLPVKKWKVRVFFILTNSLFLYQNHYFMQTTIQFIKLIFFSNDQGHLHHMEGFTVVWIQQGIRIWKFIYLLHPQHFSLWSQCKFPMWLLISWISVSCVTFDPGEKTINARRTRLVIFYIFLNINESPEKTIWINWSY